MHEAFETNHYYNDISTHDRSREGADEAIELSQVFKNPNLFEIRDRRPAPALRGPGDRTRSPCRSRNAKSVIDSETGLRKRGLWAFAVVFTKQLTKGG